MRRRSWQVLGLGAAVIAILVLIFVMLSTPQPVAVPASPTFALPSARTSASTTVVPSASASAPPSPSAGSWSRGMYIQTIDPKQGLIPTNTRLVSVTRTLQRTEVHNEMTWLAVGPWSTDGTAVIADDQSTVESVVIWPDSLTKLPTGTQSWTWLDAVTVAAVGPTAEANDKLAIVRVDAHTGQVLKREPVDAWPYGSMVRPTGDWIAFSTVAPDAPNFEAITVSTTQRVSSGPRTLAAGWLPDGRLVFVLETDTESTVEVRDPARPDATVLGRFAVAVEVLAQPSSAVIVVHDPRIDKNQLWTLRGTVQRAVPLQYSFYGQLRLDSLSHDGHTASFSMPAQPPVGVRTGVIDLDTGAVTFICEGGCWGLSIN